MNRLFFLLILVLGFVLRLYDLSGTPVSLSHDEVAIGYNAWSILKTGNDEYGSPFPVLFRSFDDYKLPGYIYVTVASEAIFGLNAFAVRFPSAFFGFLTIPVFYVLLREFLTQIRGEDKSKLRHIPLLGALMLSISPWHINFSRQAFEANLSLFFIVLTVLFILKMNRKIWNFIPAVIFSVFAIYTYYTARILLPVLFGYSLFSNIYTFKKQWKVLLIGILFGVILMAPIIPAMFTSGFSRINQVSIFNNKAITNEYTQAIVRHDNALWAKIIFNRRIGYFQEFTDNYFKNLSPDFYFANGTRSMGLLYIWEVPLFIMGLVFLVRIKSQAKWIFILWFLTVPLVGGFSVQQPNPLRTLANAPLPALFTSLGVLAFFGYKKPIFRSSITRVFLICVALFFFARFLVLYFTYEFVLNADRFGDGNSQMADFVKGIQGDYSTIFITGDRWRPYTHLLFYWEYDPTRYQSTGSKDGFENIRFGRASWDSTDGILLATSDLSELNKGKTLYILTQNDYEAQKNVSSENGYVLDIKKMIDGKYVKNAFYAVEVMRAGKQQSN